MPNAESIQSQKPRLLVPVCTIAVGVALCVIFSQRGTRDSGNNLTTPLPAPSIDSPIDLAPLPPRPELNPKEVVEQQMAATRAAGDDPAKIYECFSFASPSNRQSMGSPENLLAIIRASYSVMLTGNNIKVGEAKVADRASVVSVTLTDSSETVHTYNFFLSRQIDPPYTDCWMTDGVVAVSRVPANATLTAPPTDQNSSDGKP